MKVFIEVVYGRDIRDYTLFCSSFYPEFDKKEGVWKFICQLKDGRIISFPVENVDIFSVKEI